MNNDTTISKTDQEELISQLLQSPEVRCRASYLIKFSTELSIMKSNKAIASVFSFITSVFLLISSFLIMQQDLWAKIIATPTFSEQMSKLSNTDIRLQQITVVVFLTLMLFLAKKFYIVGLNSLDVLLNRENKTRKGLSELKQELHFILYIGVYFVIQAFLISDVSVYCGIPLAFIVIMSAPITKFTQISDIHRKRSDTLLNKMSDKQEMSRIAKIIDTEGEYYDPQADMLFTKEDGIILLKNANYQTISNINGGF